MRRLLPLLSAALLPLAGCPDEEPRRTDAGEVDVHDTVEPDAADTIEPDGDTIEPDTGEVDAWPWPADPVDVPPSDGWRATLSFPEEPFASQQIGSPVPTPTWVKLTVLVGDPTRVYFQDSVRYPLHFDFASAELPPFLGATPEAFDAATLDSGPSKRALLGAVLIAPRAAWGEPPVAREVGVTLTGRDPLPPIVVETVLALVRDQLIVTDEGAPPAIYYFPAFEQRDQARRDQARLAAAGFPVSGPERWAQADACHVRGWALGRLVHLAGVQFPADLDAAYADGRLGPDDLLLLDEPLDHLPPVAGLLTLGPGSATSTAAALAQTYGVPYVHLATAASRDAALALAGRRVAVRAGGYGDLCAVSLVDLEGTPYQPHPIPPFPPGDLAALRALKQPAPLALPPRPGTTTLTRAAAELTSSDAAHFGATSTRYAALAQAAPEAAPSPALALSFTVWDRLTAPARATLDALPTTFPADAPARGALASALASARIALSPPADLVSDVTSALRAAGLSDTTPLVLAPSSNLDTATTLLAPLFPDQRACLADDADGDAQGPSRCDPSDPSERTLTAALAALAASAYTPHAYLERLRRAVAEDRFALGALVYPAPSASATGLATFTSSGNSAFATLMTQRAPVPVTHRLAQPERVAGGVYSFGTFLDTLQYAETVPLGAHVMRWEDDYQALVALLARAFDGVLGADGEGSLDFAFARAATFQLTRLHQRPPVAAERDTPTYLLPEPPVTLCTFQGEHGAILGNWRLKARVTLSHRPTRLDEASRRDSLYTHVRVERPTSVVEGDPSIFEGFTHDPGGSDEWGNPAPTLDSWLAGDDGTRWAIQTSLPWLASDAEVPLQILSDAWLTLDATYTTPRPEPDQWPDGTTTLDSTRLTACPEDVPITPRHHLVHRTATLGELGFDIRFYWPPPPTGPTAGYTAPLAAWDRTILTGLTSAPIELRGYWSQTYRPGHHNFTESFVFEPALEPDLPPELLAELEAKDIRAVLVELGYEAPKVHLIGLDGTPRPLGVGP